MSHVVVTHIFKELISHEHIHLVNVQLLKLLSRIIDFSYTIDFVILLEFKLTTIILTIVGLTTTTY